VCTVVPDVRFDGVAENFTRTVTLADGPAVAGRLQCARGTGTALGNGDWMIRIVIDADADLYPTGTQVGFSLSAFAARQPAGRGRQLAACGQPRHGSTPATPNWRRTTG
jgi:hypothetical protein